MLWYVVRKRILQKIGGFYKIKKKKFKIDLNNPEYMFENSNGYSRSEFEKYKQWDKLIKKIMSI